VLSTDIKFVRVDEDGDPVRIEDKARRRYEKNKRKESTGELEADS